MISNGTGNGAPRSADTPTDMTPPRYAVDGREPSVIARPASLDDLAAALRDAHAAGQAVIPWGAGSQMALGAMPSRYDVALDLSGLDAIVEHDAPNLTITAQAGARLSSLQAALAEAGQFLPLDPAYPEATIGGLIATDASGGWRLGYGTLRDLVLGVRLVLADGTVLKLGGKTMKNVAGYDLIKPVVGSLGTLGVVAEATLRAYAHPPV
ncbi:MAG: FAD-binding oxidoreductase, partial [Anaerolineae bacterium]|nr:FAD-binding oxidoreductase [Anaerolineae bacterium]